MKLLDPQRLTPLLAWRDRLAGHWRGSQAERGWHWWRDELLGMLPAPVRARLGAGASVQLIDWPLAGVPAANEARQVLLLPRTTVLIQPISLPLAAARDVNAVLGYELDKYTPYRPQELYYCARTLGKQANSVQVQLVAILRERLQPILDECRAQGLHLSGVDVRGADGGRLGVDLLPGSQRLQAKSRGKRLNLWLGLACAGLLLTLMWLWLDSRQALLAQMQDEVREQQRQVAEVRQLRQELANTQGAASYLIQRKLAQPTLSTVLTELASCLPKDSFVEQLEINDQGEVSFSGQSSKASALIGAMARCPSLMDAKFEGVIRPDEDTGKDRFSLRAQLHKEAADAPTPDPT
ncbi:PilN domain-containing protein [Pseudomonas sp. nanlin1]|uniref:PilN domain-containing protein n=1 Tax=Pseudomonas sp. nanlin1 TaxID=3040605 RepID=UPI00388D9E34